MRTKQITSFQRITAPEFKKKKKSVCNEKRKAGQNTSSLIIDNLQKMQPPKQWGKCI